ncbi:uncharacterized protein LOC134543147 isoform X2 [Bacillus rossius redtenbacheri]|uniref:uncharacterized protein LOC134543147 isoform X2 n=1 Tax=Bacillus rossius redtenbacheri TaxID=93214 RepID=UPI002FDE082C
MMSSAKSASLGGEKDSDKSNGGGGGGEIVKMGYLRKLKTMRKKFFVLRGDCSEYSSRLEYYDSEKKWKTHHAPKRCIVLKMCFNINRRLDTKHKHVIALYTKDDCFCLVLETEEELEDWLKALLSLQHGEDVPDGAPPKPVFEHVWQVVVQKRGLGNTRNILGPHHLCLTEKTLTLVKMTQDEKPETYEFSLMSIRRCGHSECFFYMEVGRSSCTGAGDLWMQTEDPIIAENMHEAILSTMKTNSSKEDLPSRTRTRSSSSNESSKPISVVQRRQTLSGMGVKPTVYAASDDSTRSSHHSNQGRTHALYSESLSASITDSGHIAAMCVSSAGGGGGAPTHQRTHSLPLSEPQSLPPWETRRGSTGRAAKRSASKGSTATRDRSDSMPSRPRTTSEGHHPLPLPHPARNAHLAPCPRPHSMYSRGISYSPPVGSSPVSPASGACSTDSAGSSLSIDDGDGWGDVAPDGSNALGRYGHSLTPDEPVILEENCDECLSWSNATGEKCGNYMPMDRSVTCLSLPIHPITTVSNSVPGSGPHRKFSPNLSSGFKIGSPSQSSYVEMYSPCSSSPMDPPGGYMTMSPGGALPDGARTLTYSRATSSANHSRGSSLAEETPDGYVPMAPGVMDDGYVDMDPIHPGPNRHLNDDFHHGEMSPASSCSITSGTPSTDLRFSEYHLEKVSSYFTPSEEDETSSLDRPIRAYSVGSRPDIKKLNRLDIGNQVDAARVRAFSVGSRTGTGSKLTASRLLSHDLHSRYHTSSAGPTLTPPTHHHHHLQSTPTSYGKKSLSAPLLSNSWSGSSNFRHAHTHSSHSSIEPMDDLMEMDFSHHRGTRSNKTSSSFSKTSVKSKLDAALPPSGSLSNHDRSLVTHNGSSGSNGDTPRSLSKLSTAAGPYLEMKPSLSGESHVTPSAGNKSTTVSPKTSVSSGPYEEMKCGVSIGEFVINRPANHNVQGNANSALNVCQEADGSSPLRPTPGTSPKASFIGSETSQLPFNSPKNIVCSGAGHAAEGESAGPYLEMKPRGDPGGAHNQSFATVVKHLSARKPTSPIQEEYMDMSLGRQPLEEENDVNCPLGSRTAPVDTPQAKAQDTSWSSSKPSPKSALEGFRPQVAHAEDDYMTVNYDGHGGKKKEKKGSRKDRRDRTRYSSQPIAIQSSNLPKDPVLKSTSSTSPIFSLSNLVNMSGRKHSAGTPPKIPPGFLPLDGSGHSGSSPGSSPFSSLRRTRNRKRNSGGSRRESSDINSGVTTPTGSNVAIFPFSLNSPSSPMKLFPGKMQNVDSGFESSSKCPVDATSGTVRISYPYSELQQPVISPDSGGMTSESSSSSEQPTPVNLAAGADNEYVNYSPKQPPGRDEYDNYTLMHPIPATSSNMVRKISAPLLGISHVQQGLSKLTVSSPSLAEGKVEIPRKSTLGFQPITKPPEQTPPPKVITSCHSPSALFQEAARFVKPVSSDRECPEVAGNKPEVSADERSKESTASSENSTFGSRPPSVVSERELHYASLDLASSGSKDGEDGSCSPHGLKSQSSLTESSTSSSSPNPSSAGTPGGKAFTYAEIDFVKSEDLKNQARKTKH